MRTRVCGWKVTAAMVGCISTLGLNGASNGEEHPSWRIRALVLERLSTERSSVRVWLDITNSAKAPKVLCVRRVWYSVFDEDAPGYGGTADTPLAQSCGDDVGRHLVPPGHSLYSLTRLELDTARRAASRLTFQVDLIESDPYTGEAGAETSINWRGTLADAIEAGKQFSSDLPQRAFGSNSKAVSDNSLVFDDSP